MANILLHSVKCSRLSESAANGKQNTAIWLSHCGVATASVAFPVHAPSKRCMSAKSVNEYSLRVLGRCVMCFPKHRLLQTDSKCNTYCHVYGVSIDTRFDDSIH
jgi:hypothetical protein